MKVRGAHGEVTPGHAEKSQVVHGQIDRVGAQEGKPEVHLPRVSLNILPVISGNQ